MALAGGKKYLQYSVVSLLSFAVSLGLAELIYSAVEPAEQKYALENCGKFMDYDPKLGWRNKPNLHSKHTTSIFSVNVITNAQGMRDDPVGPKTKTRIAVLGDSIAWGWGAEHDQRFDTLLEKELGVEMLNFGVIGYTPLQYYMQLDKVIATKPDMVMLMFVLTNDFNNNLNIAGETYRPYATLDRGKIKLLGYPIPDFRNYEQFPNRYGNWLTNFALGRLLFFTLKTHSPELQEAIFGSAKNLPPLRGHDIYQYRRVFRWTELKRISRVLDLNQMILKRMRDKLQAEGIELVVVGATTANWWEKSNLLEELVRKQTRQLGVPFIALGKGFKFNPSNFNPVDRHWSLEGQKAAAKIIKPRLQKLLKRVKKPSKKAG